MCVNAKRFPHFNAFPISPKYRFRSRRTIPQRALRCPYHIGREKDNLCQPMTTVFQGAGVDMEKFRESGKVLNRLYQQMQKEGKIKTPENVLFFYYFVDDILHFNSTG